MSKLDHNVPLGSITRCQVCGSENLELVIDLGHQPLCDSLLTEAQLNEPEDTYPLRLWRCLECSLAQIDYAVDGSIVYHPAYPYRSGITKELVTHQRSVAADVIGEFGIPKDSLVVDIGSNDGTLLRGFKEKGMRVMGVEPTNIAEIARKENGVDTVQAFFTEETAREIAKQHGKARVMTATNVFAHMAPLGDVMRGMSHLLHDDGVFVTESHYLPEIIKGVQYDTIYHEHLRSYSLKSLVKLFDLYGFTIVHTQVVNRYAGSIRVCAMRHGKRSPRPTVAKMLDAEKADGVYEKRTYDVFRDKTRRARDDLMRLALRAQSEGARFVANSCPGRGSTLVNYTGLSADMMPYICEQPTSLKLGLYLPGKHIPIVTNDRLIKEQPEYVLLLAWHYADAIVAELRGRGLRSKLIVPLPEVHVLEA